MKSIVLYLSGNVIKACSFEESIATANYNSEIYNLDKIYFGDWVALRNSSDEIIGFKIIPFVDDDYLEKNILMAKLVKLAANLRVERGRYTYIFILMKHCTIFTEDIINRIEAAVLRNRDNDFILRLDGFFDLDFQHLGFRIEEKTHDNQLPIAPNEPTHQP